MAWDLPEAAMAYVMIQYDRPTDTKNWNDYNGRVRDWIAQLLAIPGAVSFMAYRTVDGASPNTTTLLEFRTADEARRGTASEELKDVLQGLKAVGAYAKIQIVERSPFTPEPLRPEAA
jgi:uncharacterized protein (DUF1330 family)